MWGRSDLRKNILVGVGRCRLGTESIRNQRANVASHFAESVPSHWKSVFHRNLQLRLSHDRGKPPLTLRMRGRGDLSRPALRFLQFATIYNDDSRRNNTESFLKIQVMTTGEAWQDGPIATIARGCLAPPTYRDGTDCRQDLRLRRNRDSLNSRL